MNIRALMGGLFLGGLIFVLGLGLGMLLSGGRKSVPSSIQTQESPNLISVLSSKIVPSIIARGRVIKIDGNNITLAYQSDSTIIRMRNDATVSMLVSAPQTLLNKNKYVNKSAIFSDIKIGDNLEINVRVLQNGEIEGFSIVIFPSSTPI